MLTIIANAIQSIKEGIAFLEGYTLIDRIKINLKPWEYNYIINGEDII